ncbi:CaiB/BaiF CoA transferase family protein [Hydrogenophaga intermedia]|uniref:CaiB/BaiF CoA transferase family protein n=1 Tax=Hydrogenophaga intermedia TaxID=65786 RepID=UPI002042C55C|nr:CoA transferase [Hydrogenophaga intermedia]MCM3562717.1 CoA transferase [Hydrogenophaga intermedia]
METTRPGALDGLRVLDLSRVLAGPLCAQMLADHGANVIKVEPPEGDETRRFGPPLDERGEVAYFGALNRGKRSIAVDLSRTAGRAVLEQLLADADVLIENFLPGTMEKWGLGYDASLAPRHPRLVYCSVSGFGGDGPLGGLPGYDAVLQAICGLMSVNGEAGSGALRIGVPVVDYLTGYNAFSGVLLALAARERTGLGQRVEATLFDTGLALLVPHASNWFYSGRVPQRMGSSHPNIAPYDRYAAADGDVFLGVVNNGQFKRFCECVSRPDLAADPRFTDNSARLANREPLRAEIERTLIDFPAAALCEMLMRHGVPAGPVNDVAQALSQPHAAHRAMVIDQQGHRSLGLPVKLSASPGRAGALPPRLSEHADAILDELGYGSAAIEALHGDGTVTRPPE